MDYTRYIEHDPENLQFYLWHRDYVKRFNDLPASERRLAPEWTTEQANTEAAAVRLEEKPKRLAPAVAAVLKGTDFDDKTKTTISEAHPDPFKDPPRTPNTDRDSMAPSSAGWSDETSTLRTPANHAKSAATAFESVDAQQPCKPRYSRTQDLDTDNDLS